MMALLLWKMKKYMKDGKNIFVCYVKITDHQSIVTRREKENLPILKEEIVKAIKSMLKVKAAGPDEVLLSEFKPLMT